jgi:two-component system sensor histidine kinase SenX3
MPESRSTFHHQLDDLQRDLIRVAARVTELIMRGTEALLALDLGAAQTLIDSDDEIDALTLDIEERCFTILARQQPVAGDMRAVVTAIRLTSEIERSADLMVNVAKATRRLYGSHVPPALHAQLREMADEAVRLYRLAMDAYRDRDADLAAALDDMDDRLDQLHTEYIEAILELPTDVRDVQVAVQLALVGRYYERIGDHAVNIGERVQYMVTGWLPEHAGATRHRLASEPVAQAPAAALDLPPLPDETATEADARLARALAVIPVGVVVCDDAGRLLFRNDVAQRILADPHGSVLVDEAIAEVAGQVVLGHPAAPRVLDMLGPPPRVLVLTGLALQDPGCPGVVVVIDDVTERRRLETVRRDFVANISHELKTPVGALALLAETLLAEEEPAVAQRLAKRLSTEALRVGRTIDDLLELSRIEADEIRHHEAVPVAALFVDALERAQAAADQRQITLEVEEPPADLAVVGDRRQILSATHNLLDNAVKYSEPGSAVQLRARRDGGWADIDVQDHGIGIPPRDLERIFERFYRVDRGRSRETGGTGLGLAIVRHVASNHGGDVRVTSVEGEGSTFTLRLLTAGAGG